MNKITSFEDFIRRLSQSNEIHKTKHLRPTPLSIYRGVSLKTGEWIIGMLSMDDESSDTYITPLMTLEGKLFSDEQNPDDYIGHITAEEVDPESIGQAVEPLWDDYWDSKEITKPIFAEDIVVFKIKDTLYQGTIMNGYYSVGEIENYGWYIQVYATYTDGKTVEIEPDPADVSLVHVIDNYKHLIFVGIEDMNREDVENIFALANDRLQPAKD